MAGQADKHKPLTKPNAPGTYLARSSPRWTARICPRDIRTRPTR